MKKVAILYSLLMFISLLSMGQSTKHVTLDFNMDDFKIQHDDAGNIMVLSETYDFFLKSDTLLPALPYKGFNVLIGSTEKYDSHVCSGSMSLFRNNVTMAQNPKVIPTNALPTVNGAKSAVSYSEGTYPTKYVEFVGMNECDGYRILTFHVCPFEYDATAKKLYLRKHIGIDIQLKESPSVSTTRTGNRNAVRNTIRQMVVNPEDLDEPDMYRDGFRSNNELTKQTGFEYVIVTSNQFKSTFQQLADWKNRKGIRSKVLTVDSVSSYTGSTIKEKIKRALADIDGLSYVLLGGDTLNVPTCMVYIGHHESADSITPADFYYSCLGKMNWDTDGDGLYGELCELNDTVSLIPILNVSRAPVSTLEDAQVFVNRIINYESSPDTTNWKDDILMCGSSLGYKDNNSVWHPYYDYVDGESDTQIWSQMIYNQYISPTNPNLPSWNGQLTRFYDTYTDISGDGSYEFNRSNLQGELSKGYTFVDVMTHGGKGSWQMEGSYYSYVNNQASNLENSGYSVITTTACLSNAFDFHTTYSKCLSQNFINNPQSGILAYWGTSRENWYYPKSTSGIYLGASFDALTYRKIFGDKYHRLGKAAKDVKLDKYSSALGSYNANRKIWMGLNLMGDPEMPIYLSKPKSFQNVSIQFVNDSIYVDAGTGGFDICFINQSDSTDYYIARVIADSVAVFSRINGVFDVCITKPGYVPYTTTCGDTFLQNITLAGIKNYETNNAMIGSDVTNRVAQGPVVINSGSTTIKATQETTVTKDFEVKLGAEFTITN